MQVLRRRFSGPVQLLLDDGLLTTGTSFFDYGCGYGEDVKFLKKMQFDAAGWDPHYASDKPKKPAQIVNLGYILNVIEDAAEREATLKAAFDVAERLLVVAVMIRASGPLVATETSFADLATIKRIFGSTEAAAEALRAELNPETVKQAAERHKSALLISLSRELIKTDTRLKPTNLGDETLQQLRLYFGKWDAAKAAALERLKELGDLAQVSRYINASSVGKVLPDDIYIHRDSLGYAPEML